VLGTHSALAADGWKGIGVNHRHESEPRNAADELGEVVERLVDVTDLEPQPT
jgi:hypothetical protein